MKIIRPYIAGNEHHNRNCNSLNNYSLGDGVILCIYGSFQFILSKMVSIICDMTWTQS